MHFLSSFLNNSLKNADLLAFLSVIISLLVTAYYSKKQYLNPFVEEQYKKLIFPLFKTLEPILYKSYNAEIFQKAKNIYLENQVLADGRLMECFYLCDSSPSENFIHLCSYVDRLYDQSCRKMGMKTRSIYYRINRHQYKNIYLALAFICVRGIFQLAILFPIFLIVLSLLGFFYSASPSFGNLLMEICLCLLIYLALKILS